MNHIVLFVFLILLQPVFCTGNAQVSQVTWASHNYPDDKGFKHNKATDEVSDVFDIAILKLGTKLQTPVIPFQYDDNLKPGPKGSRDKCRFAGWGFDEIGRSDDKLKKVEENGMERYTETECETERVIKAKAEFEGVPDECLTDVINHATAAAKASTCTRHKEGSVMCSGDSGGPLLCQHKNDDGTYAEEMVVGLGSQNILNVVLKTPKCFGSAKKKLLSCHDQKKGRMDFLYSSHRIANAATKAYLKKCEKVMANPESAEADAKTECFAKEYGSLEVETEYQNQ